MEVQGIVFLFPERQEILSSKAFRPALDPTRYPIQGVLETLPPPLPPPSSA
jgi:hypothetical protein